MYQKLNTFLLGVKNKEPQITLKFKNYQNIWRTGASVHVTRLASLSRIVRWYYKCQSNDTLWHGWCMV